jgi:Ca2+-binding EF-hand superfamily protein
MQALSDLAEGGIGREKSELQELRSKSNEGVVTSAPLHASKTPSAGAIVVGDSVMEEEEDADLVRMKKALNSMLDTLTVRINSTEVALGDRLKLLDLDLDGEVSIIELKTTIAKILKRATTDEEAEELARLLDKDKDGKVSVAELRLFVESSREKQEVHELEAQVKVKPLPVDSSGAEATARQ